MGLNFHMTRRKFLRTGALAAGALAACPELNADEAQSTANPVIDTHIHLYDPARPEGIPWPPKDDAVLYSSHLPADFEALTGKLGVMGAVVVEANAGPADNQWVLDLAKENPIVVGYIGRLTPGTPEFPAHLDSYSGSPVFRGLRLSQPMLVQGLGQSAFENDLRQLEERKFTLDVVGGEAMLPDVLRLAKIFPGLRVVIDHLPFQEWDTNAMRTALSEVARLSNVFGKISHVGRRVDGRFVSDPAYYRPRLDLLWELFGDDRLIYGSNWPVSDFIAPYADILGIMTEYLRGRDRVVSEKYFWRNSMAAYSWQPRGRAVGLLKE
ncbi:MAG: amidohydrolase [Verrucomicrobiaceae bacterium]|nr:MAG: amidohydrolase [Verrucomicrobiaceae bacterium]